MSPLAGIGLIVLGGVINGSYMSPMKLLNQHWSWENVRIIRTFGRNSNLSDMDDI
jgi:hypothetical protein